MVVLQSLLIAQMNHTYSNIQQDANVLLILDRARTIMFIQKATTGLPGIVIQKLIILCTSLSMVLTSLMNTPAYAIPYAAVFLQYKLAHIHDFDTHMKHAALISSHKILILIQYSP